MLESSPINFIQILDKQEVDSITPQPPPQKKMLIQVDSFTFHYVSSVLISNEEQWGENIPLRTSTSFSHLFISGPISQSGCVSSKSSTFGNVLIGNHVHGKSSRVALGLAILHKIGKCPPPGLTRSLNAPQ